MAYNKVDADGRTLIDLTSDTVTADTLVSGRTAHLASGERVTGTFEPVTGVKGNAESTYRKGDVNLTAANIGAATAAQGTKADSAVQTIQIGGTTQTKTDGIVNLPAYPTKSSLGLGNVDNTSDANKPVSTAQQTALNGKVAKAGDTMTGELRTSFGCVANGSIDHVSTITLSDFVEYVRYSSGCTGSVSLATYTFKDITISAGWYNFEWLPHQTGGKNGAANKDYCNFGTLIITGMTVANAGYIVRYNNQVIAEVHELYKGEELEAQVDYNTNQVNNNSKLSETSDTTPYLYKSSEHDAVYDELVGGSVAWNQLVQNGNFESTSGWTGRYSTVSVSNNICTVTPSSAGTLRGLIGSETTKTVSQNHKLLLSVYILSPITTNVGLSLNGNNQKTISVTANVWKKCECVWTNNVDTPIRLYALIIDNLTTSQIIQYKNAFIIDLTQMFGSTIADYVYNLEQSTTGSGIAWLKSYGFFTKDYYAYNAGVLVSANTNGKKVVSETTEITYPIQSTDLRGLYKLNGNKLYTDGDIYSADGQITRKYGIVDLGTLEWTYDASHNRIYATNALIKRNNDSTIANAVCNKYTICTRDDLFTMDKAVSINYSRGTSWINVRDTAYITEEAFKTAMSGVYLIYELATPTATTAQPFTSPQMVYRNGTEEYLDTRDVPMPIGGNRKYVDIPDWMVNEYFDDVREMLDKQQAQLDKALEQTGYNLVKITATTQTINGVTFTVDKAAGTITANGTATAQAAFVINNNVGLSLDYAGKLWSDGCPLNSNVNSYFLNYESSNGRNINCYTNEPILLGNTTTTITRALIYIRSGVTVSNLVFKPMIVPAELAGVPFQPYAKSNAELTQDLDDISEELDCLLIQAALVNNEVVIQNTSDFTSELFSKYYSYTKPKFVILELQISSNTYYYKALLNSSFDGQWNFMEASFITVANGEYIYNFTWLKAFTTVGTPTVTRRALNLGS